MRDPNRIPDVLEALRVYWEANPDLRLGQIVENFAAGDAFYLEDDAFVARLSNMRVGPVNHIINDSGPKTWGAIEDAVGSINKGWPRETSSRLDPDRPPLVYTTDSSDPPISSELGEDELDSLFI